MDARSRRADATNVEGTRTVMEAALRAGVERIVYTSSVATLAPGPRRAADETAPLDERTAIGAYKRSKVAAERLVEAMVARDALPAVIVNPSTPIGPRDISPTPTGRIIVEAAHGRMPAFVDTGLNLVHVDDVAAGHIAALVRGSIGERYILGTTAWSVRGQIRRAHGCSDHAQARNRHAMLRQPPHRHSRVGLDRLANRGSEAEQRRAGEQQLGGVGNRIEQRAERRISRNQHDRHNLDGVAIFSGTRSRIERQGETDRDDERSRDRRKKHYTKSFTHDPHVDNSSTDAWNRVLHAGAVDLNRSAVILTRVVRLQGVCHQSQQQKLLIKEPLRAPPRRTQAEQVFTS